MPSTNNNPDAARDAELPLPPDPENLNDDRAGWAQAAIASFIDKTKSDDCDAISDLLADIAHYCDRNGFDMKEELRRAAFHYHAETDGEGKQLLVESQEEPRASNVDTSELTLECLLREGKGEISSPFLNNDAPKVEWTSTDAHNTSGMLNKLQGWLRRFSVKCSVEVTCLHIPTALGGCWKVGDANDNWGMDFYEDETDLSEPTFSLELPISSDNNSNGYTLAAAICAAMIGSAISPAARDYLRESVKLGFGHTYFSALHDLCDANMLLPGATAAYCTDDMFRVFHNAVMEEFNNLMERGTL
jgi:hypothetical protein